MKPISLSDRKWLLVFDKNESLMDSLAEWCDEQKIRGASLSGIGAFSACTLGFFVRNENYYDPIEIDEQVEVTSLLGSVGCTDRGETKLHLHATVSRRDGSALGGHLISATVWPTIELFLVPTGISIQRSEDLETGLQLLT